jgi:uncharacterized protein YkwD
LRNEPAPRGTRARPRHARATSPWRGNLKTAVLIVFPLLLAWALLPASAKPGGDRPLGRDPVAAAAVARDDVRLARPGATAAGTARRSRRTTTTAAPTTTTRAATTTSRAPRTTAPPTTAAAPAGGGSTARTLTNDLFDRLNAERRARGLAALKWDDDLARVAGDWSAQMASSGNFAHRDLGAAGSLPGMSKFSALGENIAWVEGYPSMGNQLHVGWMKSEGHRANMLQRGFDSVGIGRLRRRPGLGDPELRPPGQLQRPLDELQHPGRGADRGHPRRRRTLLSRPGGNDRNEVSRPRALVVRLDWPTVAAATLTIERD